MTQKTSPSAPATPASDDFLSSIRISQRFTDEDTSVTKPLLTVPVRKPHKTEFIRVHPSLFMDCYIVERKDERETYVVVPSVRPLLAELAEVVRLQVCVSRQETVFLWPLKLPGEGQRGDTWRRSAVEIAEIAKGKWVRVSANMNLGAYCPSVALTELGEPKWPAADLAEILKIAFRDRVIDSADHIIVRELLGQA